MKCDRVRRRLSSYLDRQLDAPEYETVSRHLDDCPACREELERLAADRQVLMASPSTELPAGLRTRVMAEIRGSSARRAPARPAWARALTVAASIMVIAGCGCAGLALGSSLAQMEHRTSGSGDAAATELYRELP